LNVERFHTLKEEKREFFNDANLEHALEILRQRAATSWRDASSWPCGPSRTT
jgi:hypothetical protein